MHVIHIDLESLFIHDLFNYGVLTMVI